MNKIVNNDYSYLQLFVKIVLHAITLRCSVVLFCVNCMTITTLALSLTDAFKRHSCHQQLVTAVSLRCFKRFGRENLNRKCE